MNAMDVLVTYVVNLSELELGMTYRMLLLSLRYSGYSVQSFMVVDCLFRNFDGLSIISCTYRKFPYISVHSGTSYLCILVVYRIFRYK